ncbi:MAG: CdaR family protein [Eubacteriales bacterium]|nr:CdaR family protein [Eubacteriales bacterium]
MKAWKKRLFDNLWLKIFAFLFAAVLWLLVTNINDPVTYLQVNNVQVRLLNTNLITEQGQVYSVLDNTDVIPVVTVTAPRSVIDSLEADNIVATADVAEMTSLDTVGIDLSTNKYNNELVSITGSIDAVRLNIEARKTKSIALRTTTTGTVESGYVLGALSAEQNQVRISGPESVVDSVSTAVAEIDVSGFTSSISTKADIRLYDAENNLVDTTSLTMNMTSVSVSVDIWPVKEVPVRAETTGTPAAGYMESGEVTITPATVEIAGRSSALNKVDAITIPAEDLDLTGLSEDLVKTIDIRPYLPEGTMLEDPSFGGSVEVSVGIEPIAEKTIEIREADVTLSNVPEGYTARLVEETDDGEEDSENEEEENQAQSDLTLRVTLRGLESELNEIEGGADVAAAIDVAALLENTITADKSGTYLATVSLTLPEHVRAAASLQVRVRLESTESAAASASSSAAAAETGDTEEA